MKMQVSKLDLGICPSCNYSKGDAGYMPMLYRDRFIGKWLVECRNCGMEVFFDTFGEDESALAWNNLPRKVNP